MGLSNNTDEKENLNGYSNPLIHLSLALSAEKDISKLLEIIVDRAKELTNAEAGSLYMVEKEYLSFEILQNDPLNIYFRKQGQKDAPLNNVPLHINGRPNYSNVSTCVALTGQIIDIEDIYNEKNFDFSGTREYDRSSGFRSRSMITIPLKDREDETVAVLQLINRKDQATDKIISFSNEDKRLIRAVASQTAVAIEKTKLIQDLKDLLYSFIKAIAWAVDAKSHYTGRHIERVVDLTMEIAAIMNETKTGIFKTFEFSKEELEELKYAAWMHDIGKIVTPQYIVDKRTRLENVIDGIKIIETRFLLIEQITLLELYQNHSGKLTRTSIENQLKEIRADLSFIKKCNQGDTVMDDARINRIKKICEKSYRLNGRQYNYLTENECKNLCINRGTLTDQERKIIENHAVMTGKILNHLPFPKGLSNVPILAALHHEKPNGTGYPKKLMDKDIPVQAKILAIADIFEALTAQDRPYKKSITLEKAVHILSLMKENSEIDPDIFELCKEAGVFRSFN